MRGRGRLPQFLVLGEGVPGRPQSGLRFEIVGSGPPLNRSSSTPGLHPGDAGASARLRQPEIAVLRTGDLISKMFQPTRFWA